MQLAIMWCKEIDTGFYWYDKTNIDSEEVTPSPQ
jgi:hypothetical protein